MCMLCNQFKVIKTDECEYEDLSPLTTFANVTEFGDAPPNIGTPSTITVSDTFTGTISAVGDQDWIRVTLTAGEGVEITAERTSGGLDTYIEIRDQSGNLITENDDVARGNTDSALLLFPTYTGSYYVNVRAFENSSTGGYRLSVSEAPQVGAPLEEFSYSEIAGYLTDGFWQDQGSARHSFNIAPGGTITVDISALTSAGQQLAQWGLEAWANVTGINFNTVVAGQSAQITFDDNQSGAFSQSFGGTNTSTATVNVSTQWISTYGTGIDSYSMATYIHEIGHALGLGHAGNYNGNIAGYVTDFRGRNYNNYLNDSWQATVMSYLSQTENTSINASRAFVVTPQIADIIAIQNLYGTSGTIRTGDTTYGENSTSGGYLDQLTDLNRPVTYTIYDEGGIDTLDFRNTNSAQDINLNSEAASNIYGLVGNVLIANGTVIENVISGAGSDTIIGNAADNVITGGGGNDDIDGGGGSDTVVISGSSTSYTITADGADRLIQSGGTTIRLTDVEFIQFDDRLVSVAGINTAPILSNIASSIQVTEGEAGSIETVAAFDAQGDALTFSITGGADASLFTINENNGALTFITAPDYEAPTDNGGNNVYDVQITVSDGEFTDSVDSVITVVSDAPEVIYGGTGDDDLNGTAGDDTILDRGGDTIANGGEGDDLVTALGGNSIITDTGAAVGSSLTEINDVIRTGAGWDSIDGGAGNDIIVGDVYWNNFYGEDTLTGGTGNDVLQGGHGADVFVFRAGDGDDIIGRIDYDTLDAALAADDITQLGFESTADFEVGSDVVNLSGFGGIVNATQALALVSNNADGDAVLQTPDGSITFIGVDAGDFTTDNFLI